MNPEKKPFLDVTDKGPVCKNFSTCLYDDDQDYSFESCRVVWMRRSDWLVGITCFNHDVLWLADWWAYIPSCEHLLCPDWLPFLSKIVRIVVRVVQFTFPLPDARNTRANIHHIRTKARKLEKHNVYSDNWTTRLAYSVTLVPYYALLLWHVISF